MLSTSGEYVDMGYTIYNTTFGYDNENRPTTLNYGGSRQTTVTYDALGRVSKRTVNAGSTAVTSSYSFIGGGHGTESTSGLVQTITQPTGNLTYTYDNNGNILSVNNAGVTTSYTYDMLGQLTRVNDPVENATWVYEYDRGGNILSKKKYAYTTGTVGTVQQTIAYSYGDSNWKDKLTAYNGTTISYDAIGNPTSDGTWTYTWTNGRQLASVSKTGTSVSYTYNENGLRVQKNVNGTVTSYVLHGKNVVHLTQGSNNLHFFYGADGSPAIVEYNGVSYGYVKNLQGDIIAIVNASGAAVVQYAYDAWGKPISKTGSMASTLGTLNPFRYRGYVYDEETGLYYLRSRYYKPTWCRFINADVLINYSQILALNSFAYCSNQAINQIDSSGHTAVYIDLDDDFDHDGPFSSGFGIGGYQVDLSVAVNGSVWSSPLLGGEWTGYFIQTPYIYSNDRVGAKGVTTTQTAASTISSLPSISKGTSQAPSKSSLPYEVYIKVDNNESNIIVSVMTYNENCMPAIRDDYYVGSNPHSHYDKHSRTRYYDHRHTFTYTYYQGYVNLEESVGPIPKD